MPKIGFVAPTEQVYEIALEAVAMEGAADDVVVRQGDLEQGVAAAREMEAEGVEVIIARGGTVERIMKSEVRLPVVAVTLSCQELSQAVFDAKNITGLPRPRIALLMTRNMNQDVELFAQVLGADLTVYPVEGAHDSIARAVARAKEAGADVVIGGTFSMHLAREAGLRTVLLPTSVQSIRIALEEARKVIYAIELEQARTQRFLTLVGHLREGVLYVDPSGRVQIANPAAESMLDRSARELCARDVEEVLPLPGLRECLAGEVRTMEEIVTVGDATLVATVTPAHVGRDLSGVIISLQETNRIAQMDASIRRRFKATGLNAAYRFDDIRGNSDAIRECKRLAAEYASTDSTVLVFGETGTGKELFAQSIHNASRHANGPFVAVNCGALPSSLLESELFGYDEGAFTGANRKGKPGLIEMARDGTLFLDEISEMDPYGQARLLRFLQEKQIMRVGGDKYIPVEARVIAATNRNLARLVRDGKFREDLYYRLRVLTLNVPPLRQRHQDVMVLAEGMLADWEAKLGRKIALAPDVLPVLKAHGWPGNVRELANVLENLAVAGRRRVIDGALTREVLYRDALPPPEAHAAGYGAAFNAGAADGDPERRRIVEALAACKGNHQRAAERLGMHRSTLYRKIERHGIAFRAE